MLLNEVIIPDELKQFAELIKRDCQPYLNLNPGLDNLYRGMSINYEGKPLNQRFGKIQARLTDRKPRNITVDLHKKLNEWFIQHYGKPWRNAVFANGVDSEVKTYGDTNVIFPIGNFEFLWNPDISDLWWIIDEQITQLGDINSKSLGYFVPLYKKIYGTLPNNYGVKEIQDGLHPMNILNFINSRSKYQNNNFSDALESGCEIMVWCEGYYCVPLYNMSLVRGLIL